MTLKAIRQLTNISWIIGGVSAATAGYSYINSRKEQVFVEYNRKPLGKINSVEDIEDYEKQKGCRFLFFTKQEGETTETRRITTPRYNEWHDGGVLAARSYIDKNKEKKDKVIEISDTAKEDCTSGKIIYKEVDNTQQPVPTTSHTIASAANSSQKN
ncbi:hypothetical protein A6V39_03560 [Candidatus Mycoplasma haematobovis]|uniref:Uncharacterized protein n=1 Tax=Candidatus Mycoplasma haematobovis TaxID=432608 RepID=A0A1A9QBY1_9MOLU|nr:hypothetical protein [Candidatus Mycoplasma haematobovis]OAL09963.1 hypothetical protein A6V39_03560 [Candidatus Mycoplasma haematobovis]